MCFSYINVLFVKGCFIVSKNIYIYKYQNIFIVLKESQMLQTKGISNWNCTYISTGENECDMCHMLSKQIVTLKWPTFTHATPYLKETLLEIHFIYYI